jgi:hypothetical protein
MRVAGVITAKPARQIEYRYKKDLRHRSSLLWFSMTHRQLQSEPESRFAR